MQFTSPQDWPNSDVLAALLQVYLTQEKNCQNKKALFEFLLTSLFQKYIKIAL